MITSQCIAILGCVHFFYPFEMSPGGFSGVKGVVCLGKWGHTDCTWEQTKTTSWTRCFVCSAWFQMKSNATGLQSESDSTLNQPKCRWGTKHVVYDGLQAAFCLYLLICLFICSFELLTWRVSVNGAKGRSCRTAELCSVQGGVCVCVCIFGPMNKNGK